MIRRPLLYGASAFAMAVVISYYAGTMTAAAAALPAAAAVLVTKKRNKRYFRPVLLAAAFYAAGTVCFCIDGLSYDRGIVSPGENKEVKGRCLQVDTEAVDEDTTVVRFRLEITESDGVRSDSKEKILVSYYKKKGDETSDTEMVPGDRICVSGEVESPTGRRNPSCFDYRLYLRSIGINYTMQAAEVSIEEHAGAESLGGRMYILRENFLAELERAAGREASSMMAGILFGSKNSLDEDVLEEFQKNGTAHILAVSGLHVGIIYGVISHLWRWRKRWIYLSAVMFFFICYLYMASFAISTVRAVIMVAVHIIAGITNRKYDLASAAFLASLIILAKEPMYLFNTGFQMSFLAVLSMAILIPVIKYFYGGIFLSGAAIQLGLMPYTAYTFNYISLSAVFVNILVIMMAGLMVPLGLCAVVTVEICRPLFRIEAAVLSGLCRMLIQLNDMTAVEGVTVFSVTSPDIRLLAMYYLSMLLFLSEEGRLLIMRKRKALLSCMAAAAVVLSMAFGAVCGSGFRNADVVFVDVGQGDCIHFRTDDGKNYLIDGGGSLNSNIGKKVLKPYLLKNGVRKLDGIFVSHLHMDHYKGAAELCREGMAEKLFIYEGDKISENEIVRDTGMKPEDIVYLGQGDQVRLSEETIVDVLWPQKKSVREYVKMAGEDADENETSLIIKVSIGEADFIATGDVDEACQNRIEEKWKDGLECDVLKVAHHGSRYSYSDDFVESCAPRYAVFQVGKNNFGHPDEGVIEKYRGKGIMIYRNDRDGAVGFDFKGNGKTEVMTVKKDR